jgi:Rod binding domain-containing protein
MTNSINQIPSLSLPSMSSPATALPSIQSALEIQPGIASRALGQAVEAASTASTPMISLNAARTMNSLTGVKTHSEAELKQVAQNFESIFIQMMFKEMRNSVEKSNLFGNSQATEFFESMKDEEMSKQLAASGGIGLGNMVYQSLKKATESHLKTFS